MMTDQPELNEVAAAARDAKRAADAVADAKQPSKGQHWPLVPIGVGLGIGSAALAAAMLYANAERKKR
jgi:homoserine kinase